MSILRSSEPRAKSLRAPQPDAEQTSLSKPPTPQARRLTPSEFLRIIYQDPARLEGRIAICLFRDGRPREVYWLTADDLHQVDALADQAREAGDDLYYGVCPMRPVESGRGTAADVVEMPGIWADIDFADAASKKGPKKRYPPRPIVMEMLRKPEWRPSLIVDTGGGLHVYWLFDRPWLLRNSEDRNAAADLARKWQGMLGSELAKRGDYVIDSTWDLARLLRPAGTQNSKYGQDTRAFKLNKTGPRQYYDPQRLLELTAKWPGTSPAQNGDAPVRQRGGADLVLKSDSSPDKKLVRNLRDANPRFDEVYSGEATFDSQSEREMSLASMAVAAEWPDQEVANLLIADRRENDPGKLKKMLRIDYIRGTLAKARADVVQGSQRAALCHLQQLALRTPRRADDEESDDDGNSNGTDASSPEEILEHLRTALGVPVKGFRQLGREEPMYTLILDKDVEIALEQRSN